MPKHSVKDKGDTIVNVITFAPFSTIALVIILGILRMDLLMDIVGKNINAIQFISPFVFPAIL